MRNRIRILAAVSWLAFVSPSFAAGPLKGSADTQKIFLPGVSRQEVLDAAARVAVEQGYDLYRMKKTTAILLKPATLREVSLAGWTDAGGPRKRITFEVYERNNGIRVIGSIDLVAGLGTVGEKSVSLARQQPYRNELKTILANLREATVGNG